MEKKISETECGEFAKRLSMDWHKYKDRQQCPKCFHLLWKSDNQVDGEFSFLGVKTLVEVKQSSSDHRWNYSDPEKGIRGNQITNLDYWEAEHCMPFVFIVLDHDNGRAPKNRGAFLVPWRDWKLIECYLLSQGQKSLRLRGGRKIAAEDILTAYELEWQSGGWDLPVIHPFQHWIEAAKDAHKYLRMAYQPVTELDKVLQAVIL